MTMNVLKHVALSKNTHHTNI